MLFSPIAFLFLSKKAVKVKTVLIAECGTVTRIHLMSGFLSVVTTGWHGTSLKFKQHCIEISVEMQYEHGLKVANEGC